MNTLPRFLVRFSIIGLAVLTCGQASAQTTAGWTTLFDGRSTGAWRGFRTSSFPTNCWVVDQGTLKTVPGHELDLVTNEKYQDFELELEWRVAVGANSGIMYHVSEDAEETWQTGPEMQIVDDDHTDDGKDPLTSAGSLYDLVPPKNKKMHPAGQWNQVKLTVKGPHVEHWLNGVKIVEYELGSPELNALIAKTKFKDMPRFGKNVTGFIVLQNHGGEVWFRHIRVRKLN
jgi:hypothetical protein